jgi:hypothetical protein
MKTKQNAAATAMKRFIMYLLSIHSDLSRSAEFFRQSRSRFRGKFARLEKSRSASLSTPSAAYAQYSLSRISVGN